MCKINGYDNEFAFVLELNNKAIKDLTPLHRDLIETIFPNENENSIIKCWFNHFKQKSDILLKKELEILFTLNQFQNLLVS